MFQRHITTHLTFYFLFTLRHHSVPEIDPDLDTFSRAALPGERHCSRSVDGSEDAMAQMERPEGSASSLKRHDLLPSDSSEPQPEQDDIHGSKGNFDRPITISSRGPSAEMQFADEDFDDVNGQFDQHGPVDDFAQEDQLHGYAEQSVPYDVDPADWQQQQQHAVQDEYAGHVPQDVAELRSAEHVQYPGEQCELSWAHAGTDKGWQDSTRSAGPRRKDLTDAAIRILL